MVNLKNPDPEQTIDNVSSKKKLGPGIYYVNDMVLKKNLNKIISYNVDNT